MLKATSALTIATMMTAFVTTARADDSETCNPAYEEADTLIHSGGDQLLEARARLLVCARPVCKPWMVKECTTSLAEVEARIPSVVFSAKDAAGNDLVDVSVTTGDRELAARLDGHAIELGPGQRAFTFTRPDGTRAVVNAVVNEGEKAQRVAVTFEGPTPAPPPPTDRGGAASPFRTAGFVMAGAGVIAAGIGTIFGIKAIGNKNDANCDARGECDDRPLTDARSAATVSTIGFISGAALLAGGVSLILFAPATRTAGRRVDAAPSVANNEAGIVLRGRW